MSRAGIRWASKADWSQDTLLMRQRTAEVQRRQKEVTAHLQTLEDLADSLEIVRSSRQGGTRAQQRVLQLQAAELGAMRDLLTTPEQYELFDPAVRIWLREQARRGYRVTVPGVQPGP